MAFTVAKLAELCGATVEGGDGSRTVTAAADLRDATADQIAPLTDARYAKYLPETKAAAVVMKRGLKHPSPPPETALLYTDDPEAAFLEVLNLLHPPPREKPGVDRRAAVAEDATLGQNVYVGPFAVIGAGAMVGDGCEIHPGAVVGRGCRLGCGCVLYPHAVLYAGVVLEEETVVHAGTVLGADGFGYKFRDGRHVKVPQVGGLRVGPRAEIGANSAVDRAALGETVIGEGTKIDNLVQIGHNVRLGRHCILCGRAGVAGSVETADYVVLGAAAGVADHVRLGQGVRIGAMSGVHRDAASGTELFGYPAVERKAAWRIYSAEQKLPELVKRMRKLENYAAALKTSEKGDAAEAGTAASPPGNTET